MAEDTFVLSRLVKRGWNFGQQFLLQPQVSTYGIITHFR